MKFFSALAGFFLLSGLLFPATIYVPDNYASIQGAIDASVNGDEIIVRPGTYVENIDFLGKALTVRSEMGAALTAIDGNQAGSVVTFDDEEGSDSVLRGFTVTNGLANKGAGIYCQYDSSPTIAHNFIVENISDGNWPEGGGIFCNHCSPTIAGNTISGNFAYYGGAIHCEYDSSPNITNNMISGNTAKYDGGAIHCEFSSPFVSSNIVSGNWAGDDGGGVYFYDRSYPILVNNIIFENEAVDRGGGITCMDQPELTLTNNTVSRNSAYKGGGLYCDGSAATITNTILWNNSSVLAGKEIWLDDTWAPATVEIDYADLEGGEDSCHVSYSSQIVWGQHVIDAAPIWADPAGGNFHLNWDSPCKDTGDPNAPELPSSDGEGDPRHAGAGVDMGADEFYTHFYFLGDVVPGQTVRFHVVGEPGQPVKAALGADVLDPPYPTPHGNLYIWPIAASWSIGTIPGNGIRILPAIVPVGWSTGERYHFQAQVGAWGDPDTLLTNLLTVLVE